MPQKFEFGTRIGSGGFGVVSHATRVIDGTPFAVKHLADDLADDEEALERFRREVRIQRGLEHPHILPIVDANLAADPPWFVMPIASDTLYEDGVAGMDEDQTAEVFRAVLDAVGFVHAMGYAHRDIKPENVLLTHDGRPQLSDFGLGKNLLSDSTALTKTHAGIGSFPYVAPEQMIDMRSVDHRADIYALGKLLQFMLTGKIPVAPPEKVVAKKYRYFVQKCCEYTMEDRYQNVGEVLAAFDQVLVGVEQPLPVRELIEQKLQHYQQTGHNQDVAQVLQQLDSHGNDEALLERIVPGLSEPFILAAIAQQANLLRSVLQQYDEHVSPRGGLDFDYCDVVANFYRWLYRLWDDLKIRRLLMDRLLALGPSHNRWHIGSVVADLFSEADEVSEVMMIVDAIRAARPDDIEWFKDYLRGVKLAPPVDDALFG
jgi:hypothetical protein